MGKWLQDTGTRWGRFLVAWAGFDVLYDLMTTVA